jgi:hypothetical protein
VDGIFAPWATLAPELEPRRGSAENALQTVRLSVGERDLALVFVLVPVFAVVVIAVV